MDLYEKRDYLEGIRGTPCTPVWKSETEHPLYSIVIPAYKMEECLYRAIRSALDQDCPFPYEVIVVDDNPGRQEGLKETADESRSGKLGYYRNEKNLGMIRNWNQCLLAARAEWVVYCHDDDLLVPGALSSIDETIRRNPGCKAVLPRYVQRDNPYARRESTGEKTAEVKLAARKKAGRGRVKAALKETFGAGLPPAANLFCGNIFGPPTCGLAVNRKAFLEFGGWREGYLASDWATMLGFSRNYKAVRAVSQTGIYVWESNTSLKPEAMRQMSGERNEIIQFLTGRHRTCRFWHRALREDFRRLESEQISQLYGKRSRVFRLLKKYYLFRTC